MVLHCFETHNLSLMEDSIMGELINEIYKILSGFVGLHLITINQLGTAITVNPETGKKTFTLSFSGKKENADTCIEELCKYPAENFQRVYNTQPWPSQQGNVNVTMVFIEQ